MALDHVTRTCFERKCSPYPICLLGILSHLAVTHPSRISYQAFYELSLSTAHRSYLVFRSMKAMDITLLCERKENTERR